MKRRWIVVVMGSLLGTSVLLAQSLVADLLRQASGESRLLIGFEPDREMADDVRAALEAALLYAANIEEEVPPHAGGLLISLLPDRVAFLSEASPRSGPGHPLDDEALALVEEARSEGPVWGWVSRAGLGFEPWGSDGSFSRSLAGIRAVTFSAAPCGAGALFRMTTRAASEAQARVLADELRAFLAPFQAPSNSSAEVREAVERARVTTEGAAVRLEIPLSREALERLKTHEASRSLLSWRLGAERRERRENLDRIHRALGIREGSRVADVGAGNGFHTVRFARSVGETGRVVAVDVDESAVQALRRRVETAGLENVEVILGAAEDPKMGEQSWDAALIVNAYHEMTEPARMLERIRAALRPGGRLVLVEPYSPLRSGEPRETQVKDHILAPELAQQELQQAGFEILERDDAFTAPADSGRRDWLIAARRR